METVTIPKQEYHRLKTLDARFKEFWSYLEHLSDIKKSREEMNKNKVVSQKKLFKKLGL